MYHKDRLLYELRRLCPQELAYFPDISFFNFMRGDCDDGSEFRILEIGRVWSGNRATGVYDTSPEALFVIDKGAYHSGPPDLVPYSARGDGQRHIVNADGFAGTGVFADFREYHGNPQANPRLDNPLIISLIQFLFIIRGNRRYYFYTEPHLEPSSVHLHTLTQALHVATIRERLAARGPVAPPSGGGAQVMQPPQTPMDPTLRAKHFVLTATNGTAPDRSNTDGGTNNDTTTNGPRAHGAKSIVLVTSNRAMNSGVITDGFTTTGVRAGSETSAPSTDDGSSA